MGKRFSGTTIGGTPKELVGFQTSQTESFNRSMHITNEYSKSYSVNWTNDFHKLTITGETEDGKLAKRVVEIDDNLSIIKTDATTTDFEPEKIVLAVRKTIKHLSEIAEGSVSEIKVEGNSVTFNCPTGAYVNHYYSYDFDGENLVNEKYTFDDYGDWDDDWE